MMEQAHAQGAMVDFDDLENRLKSDSNGDTARQLIAYFNGIDSAINTLLNTGMTQIERDITMKLLQGVWAAQRIIQQTWESFHHALLAR